MQSTEKFTMRISPEINNQLTMLAAKTGRSKANTVCWLVKMASSNLPEQAALILKPKKRIKK